MHILQPKHTKLSQEEAKVLLSKYKIHSSQLPKIKKTDPVLSENIKVGDIIRIERKSDNRKVNYYRVVI